MTTDPRTPIDLGPYTLEMPTAPLRATVINAVSPSGPVASAATPALRRYRA